MTTTTDETIAVGEAELLACVPHLRAFALFLTRNRDRADDLVQDTIVRALTAAHQFRAGTNLKAWMFTILRNHYFGEVRGNRMKTQSLDEPLAHRPAVPPNQIAGLEFRDFQRAFWQLNGEGREVLILVGVSGLSYEEAATICDCPLGTIKSRISRARAELLRILDDGSAAKQQDMPMMASHIDGLMGTKAATPTAALPSTRKADLRAVKALAVAAE